MNLLVIYDGYTKVDPNVGSASSAAFYTSKHLVEMGHNVTVLERRNSIMEPAVEHIEGISRAQSYKRFA